MVFGNGIVWVDQRNGHEDIYAAIFSPEMEILINTDAGAGRQVAPSAFGDYIFWSDRRNGGWDVYGYQISTRTEFRVNQDATSEFFLGVPRPAGDYVAWSEERNGLYSDIILYEISSASEQILDSSKRPSLELRARVAEYDAIVFGDALDFRGFAAITIFDAADAAQVPMLGYGTGDTETPLAVILADDGRFALSSVDDSGTSDMEINVTIDGQGHAIFAGIDTSTTILLESGGDENDEQLIFSDVLDPDSPADWTVLATFGSNMGWADEPAIVTFTTPAGTRVILDGSANSYDRYDYWTQTRWDLFYNEVNYLMRQ